MNKKTKRFFSIVLVACILLSLVPLHATSFDLGENSINSDLTNDEELSINSNIEKNNEESSSLSSEQELLSPTESNNNMDAEQHNILTMDDEETVEIENDNWELGLVFYDSAVDNGKTPLTEINWNKTDDGYNTETSRVITVQINYKNTNAITTYQPGELEISIPNLVYSKYDDNNSSYKANWDTEILVGANDATHSGYDWSFKTFRSGSIDYQYPTRMQESYVFYNANIIEEKSNFEGSIQIVYTIKQISHTPEKFDDECTVYYNKDIQAELKNIVKSNNIIFNYTKDYVHPWEYTSYKVIKTAEKLSSYDGLEVSAANYTWVKYSFYHTNSMYGSSYPNINAINGSYKDNIPEGCLVFSSNFNQLFPNENNDLIITASNYSGIDNKTTIIVGYPKSVYNDSNGNLEISNKVELYGTYENKTEEEFLADDTISLNLAEFNFNYSGNLYGINKTIPKYQPSLHYQSIINNYPSNSTIEWGIVPTAKYIGIPMTVKVGDDLLYATTKDNSIEKLEDDEYYFNEITWNTYSFKNGNNQTIDYEKYDCELWVRYANENDYVLLESFKNPKNNKTWKFDETKKVSQFYFLINNVVETISSGTLINAATQFTKKDIKESGTLYNFDYIQVFFKDEYGNLILQNPQTINNYSNFITKEKIASYDIDTYGNYIQRATNKIDWVNYKVHQISAELSAIKTKSSIIQDAENEQFTGSFTVGGGFKNWNLTVYKNDGYVEQYDPSYAIQGFEGYDLLPKGMTLTSTREDILNSIKISPYAGYVLYDTNLKKVGSYRYYKNIKITENWNNTGRTLIYFYIKFENPMYIVQENSYSGSYRYTYTYNYEISYDSFLELGSTYDNYCYVKTLDTQEKGVTLSSTITDNGRFDEDAIDINNNGFTTDRFVYSKQQAVITSIISTHQDVTKYVKTDLSNYSTGKVESSYDSEYEYKLRVRTGQNDITNLVIYDSIEEYAQNSNGDIVPAYGIKKHWNGEFLGIDTSYAEAKGYKVKVYYSENKKAGNLSDDNSWKIYDDTVDKSKVKSLAFEYLDTEGKPAKLPANSLTYVIIKMKSPADENITSLAYNGCRTQWQALDDYDRPVDFITGINSNIVKVSLPNSIEDKEINIRFNKRIDSANEDFENIKLDKNNNYNFFISLTNQETGEIINGILDSKEGFLVNSIPIGTYIINEHSTIWFEFFNMMLAEPIEGIDFQEIDGEYIMIINPSVESGITANIDVTNNTENERFYDNKYNKINIFDI